MVAIWTGSVRSVGGERNAMFVRLEQLAFIFYRFVIFRRKDTHAVLLNFVKRL